jgi:hypothetical protein
LTAVGTEGITELFEKAQHSHEKVFKNRRTNLMNCGIPVSLTTAGTEGITELFEKSTAFS